VSLLQNKAERDNHASRQEFSDKQLSDLLASLDDAKTGIPAVPSDEVIKQITKEVHLHMFCDEWATCCVCDERAPTKALPGQSRTHYSCLPNTLPGSACTICRITFMLLHHYTGISAAVEGMFVVLRLMFDVLL